LAATIQALEVQKMTLATLKGMNFSMGDVANAFKLKTADTVMSGVQKAADTVSGAAEAMTSAAARVTGRGAETEEEAPEADEPAPAAKAKPKAKGKTAAVPDTAVVDPMQWWGALTSQFQQIAANAMKDAAKQTAIDTTKNMATGLAKEAFKTATGMASQFAAKGMQSVKGSPRKAAAPAKKKAAAPARKVAAKPAAKTTTKARSSAARKRAG
jgi:hypothetical protein